MRLSDIYSLARRSIKSNKLRTYLTVAIIAIGITALIGIITVIEVLRGTIYSNFTSMGANTFTITNQVLAAKGVKHGSRKRRQHADDILPITITEAKRFQDLYQYPSTTSISIITSNTATLKKGTKKTNPNIMVMGVDEKYLTVAGTNLEVGRNFTASDVNATANVCILGNALAEKFYTDKEDAINSVINIGSTRYRVLGIMESKGASLVNRTDNMVLIPLNNARSRYDLSQKSYVLSVMIADVKLLPYAVEEAQGVMRTVRKLHSHEENNFSVSKNDDIANSLLDNIKYVTLAASVIGLITLLGAAIGLMNIMLVSVAERTREIGLSKAIGATSRSIKVQFLTEAILISVTGGVIGIVVGILIGNLLSLAFSSPFVVPWFWIALGISLCIAVGLLAGIYPAIKASRLNPINALRYE